MKLTKIMFLVLLIQLMGSFQIYGKWKLRTSSLLQCILTINFQGWGNAGENLLKVELSTVPKVSFIKSVDQSFLLNKQINSLSSVSWQAKDKQNQSLLLLLTANVIYFSIKYDQLVLTSVFEDTGYEFYRVERQSTNGIWNNSYYLDGDGEVSLLFSDGDTFSMCGGKIIVNYTILGLNRLVIFNESIYNNSCKSNVDLSLLDLLLKSHYFRLLQNGTLQMLDFQYKLVFNLDQLPQYKADYIGLTEVMANLTFPSNPVGSIGSSNLEVNSSNSSSNLNGIANNTNINDLLGVYRFGLLLSNTINTSSKNIIYLFGTNTIFLTGTCLNYKFNYNLYNNNYINVTQSTYKQVLPNSGNCIAVNDLTFIQPLIQARSYQKNQSKVILYHTTGKVVVVLTKVS